MSDTPHDGTSPRSGSHPEGYADDARRYRLDSRIATGGMGEVWRATDEVLHREVAVKLLKTELSDDGGFRARFETEARNAARLQHPGVAGVFDYGQASPRDGSSTPRPYLVMELVNGQPLSDLIRPGTGMPPAVVAGLLAQAADAIGAAHAAGVVHRDVKPANLLVTPDRTMKITDFGIARAAEGVALTQTGQVMGTPQYLAPEQAEGREAVPASDVYSLACVAFECLTGRRPFTGESSVAVALAHIREPVPTLPPDVPEDLAAVVRRGLAKDPSERYADGTEFARALRNPSGAATAATAVTPPVRDATSTSVMPAVAAGAAGAGLGAAAAAASRPPVPPPTSYRTTTTEERSPDDDRRRRKGTPAWLPVAVLVVAALVAILVLALVFGGGGDDEPSDEPTPTPSEQTSEPAEEEPTTPAPEPEPEPEPTPTPTEEPEPEPTPTPTEEPEPEPTPTPTEEPEPTTPPTSENEDPPGLPTDDLEPDQDQDQRPGGRPGPGSSQAPAEGPAGTPAAPTGPRP